MMPGRKLPSSLLTTQGQIGIDDGVSAQNYIKLGSAVIDLAERLKNLSRFIEAKLTTYIQVQYDSAQSGCFQSRVACYFDNQGKFFQPADCDVFNREIQNIRVNLKNLGDYVRQISQLDKNAKAMADQIDTAKDSADRIQEVVRQRLMVQWNITL